MLLGAKEWQSIPSPALEDVSVERKVECRAMGYPKLMCASVSGVLEMGVPFLERRTISSSERLVQWLKCRYGSRSVVFDAG